MTTSPRKGKTAAERDSRNVAPCKCCKRKKKGNIYPVITETEGMFYARCPECRYYDLYEFLAISEKRVLELWTETMEGKGSSE